MIRFSWPLLRTRNQFFIFKQRQLNIFKRKSTPYKEITVRSFNSNFNIEQKLIHQTLRSFNSIFSIEQKIIHQTLRIIKIIIIWMFTKCNLILPNLTNNTIVNRIFLKNVPAWPIMYQKSCAFLKYVVGKTSSHLKHFLPQNTFFDDLNKLIKNSFFSSTLWISI